MIKACKKCGEEKEEDSCFRKNRGCCIVCELEMSRDWKKRNADKQRIYKNEYYKKTNGAYSKKYYQENRDRKIEYNHKYYESRKEKERERCRSYRNKNPHIILAITRRNIDGLLDSYVYGKLNRLGFDKESINKHPEIKELYITTLKLKRQLCPRKKQLQKM